MTRSKKGKKGEPIRDGKKHRRSERKPYVNGTDVLMEGKTEPKE